MKNRKSREHWACPSGALVGSCHVLSAPTALGKMKLCPHLGGGKDEGERGSWGPALRVSIHHHSCALPLRCWQRSKNVGERKQSGGGRVAGVRGPRGVM